MIIECTDNSGFEDQLQPGQDYIVIQQGKNDYLIENDKNEQHWYGAFRFDVVFQV